MSVPDRAVVPTAQPERLLVHGADLVRIQRLGQQCEAMLGKVLDKRIVDVVERGQSGCGLPGSGG